MCIVIVMVVATVAGIQQEWCGNNITGSITTNISNSKMVVVEIMMVMARMMICLLSACYRQILYTVYKRLYGSIIENLDTQVQIPEIVSQCNYFLATGL